MSGLSQPLITPRVIMGKSPLIMELPLQFLVSMGRKLTDSLAASTVALPLRGLKYERNNFNLNIRIDSM